MNKFLSTLVGVASVSGILFAGTSAWVNSTEKPSIQTVAGKEKARIFNEVVSRQTELGLCEGVEDLAENLEQADVYVRNDTQYLVQVLCFNAAYQGNYEFVYVDTTQTPWEISQADFYLAGYPTFDPETGILSNAYKFNGAGSCVETSSYYWDGFALRLVSSRLVDGVANGCEELRLTTADTLITATGVGVAELGMTLGELRERLPENSELEPVQLGVDLPSGLQVSFYDEAQFKLGFDTFDPQTNTELPITDQSTIAMIIVDNPSYQTETGVGVGTLVADAIAQYGSATLSYHTEAESREWIEFANQPFSENTQSEVLFRSNQWTVTDFAGIYPNTQNSYHETQEYHDHAAIGSIWMMQTP